MLVVTLADHIDDVVDGPPPLPPARQVIANTLSL